ncbi:MAG: hypothetical protein R2706_20025 [Acidimicrobiales bacterium]
MLRTSDCATGTAWGRHGGQDFRLVELVIDLANDFFRRLRA